MIMDYRPAYQFKGGGVMKQNVYQNQYTSDINFDKAKYGCVEGSGVMGQVRGCWDENQRSENW